MSRAQLTSTVEQNTGGAVAPYVAGKNFVINGGFDFYQRSSFSTTTSGYSLDRWYTSVGGSASATTVTQQTTGVPNGSQYCMRVAMGAGSGYGNIYHFLETKNTAALWGKTVTISMKLRRSSNFTRFITLVAQKSVTVDANIGATWVVMGSADAGNANMPTGTTSSDWYTISLTVAVPNDGTANSFSFYLAMSNVDTSSYYEIAQAQLEIGSVATTFARAGGTLSGELMACQRYYWRNVYTATGDTYFTGIMGWSNSSSQARMIVNYPVTMRNQPSFNSSGASTFAVYSAGNGFGSGTGIGMISSSQQASAIYINPSSASLTPGTVASLNANNTSSAYLEFSAEL